MKVLRVKKTAMYDVFTGAGWDNWTRVMRKEGHLQHIKGRHLPRIRVIEAAKIINGIEQK